MKNELFEKIITHIWVLSTQTNWNYHIEKEYGKFFGPEQIQRILTAIKKSENPKQDVRQVLQKLLVNT